MLLLHEKLFESVLVNFKCIEQCLTLQIISVCADIANKAQGVERLCVVGVNLFKLLDSIVLT